MAISNTETIGFLENLVQLMTDNQADLKAKGLDVQDWITEIGALKNDAVTKNTAQDAMQAALKAKTKEAQTATKLGYDTGSTRLDAIIGVLGKTSPLGKQTGKPRSTIIKKYGKTPKNPSQT